jgi:hypothetical protein
MTEGTSPGKKDLGSRPAGVIMECATGGTGPPGRARVLGRSAKHRLESGVAEKMDTALPPVGFQNSVTGPDLGFYAARSYSLMRPPRTSWHLIRSWEKSATGWSGRGGRSWRPRWGRRPL